MKILKNLRQLFFYCCCCCCCQYQRVNGQQNSSTKEKFTVSDSSPTTSSSAATENSTKPKVSKNQRLWHGFKLDSKETNDDNHRSYSNKTFIDHWWLPSCPKFFRNFRRTKMTAASIPSIKLLLIGLDNVGKTTLARYLAGGKYWIVKKFFFCLNFNLNFIQNQSMKWCQPLVFLDIKLT